MLSYIKYKLQKLNDFIDGKLQKVGIFLDKTLLKSSKREDFFCLLFDITSKITWFLLFHTIGHILLIFSIGLFVREYFYHLGIISLLIRRHQFSFELLFHTPIGFQCYLLFVVLFLLIAWVNTLLAYSPKVKKFMTDKYHKDIMKDLGYG